MPPVVSRRRFLRAAGAGALVARAAPATGAGRPTTRRIARRTILVVTDGGPGGRLHCTFAPGRPPADDGASGDWFNLSEVVRVLAALPGYRVVKAHRDVDPVAGAADLERFRFDAVDLASVDQVWLFGVGRPPDTAPLAEEELLALARFMDGGGGVFATGDHADIGMPLCGRVPRVRSMRTWFVRGAPDGEPVAPDPLSERRVDSTQPGAGETRSSPDYRFDNQSDDVPAPITLTAAGARHALLALPGGRRLSVLPDHMHEGEVFDPFALPVPLSPVLTYGTLAAPFRVVEYPTVKGFQPRPRVLALGTTLGGHSTISTEPQHVGAPIPTAPGDRPYGAIGAYDGHAARVGRVVVTSTFHHFVDVNLIGDPWAVDATGVPDAARRQGFTATPAGRAVLDDLHAFWGNVVRWLSRPSV